MKQYSKKYPSINVSSNEIKNQNDQIQNQNDHNKKQNDQNKNQNDQNKNDANFDQSEWSIFPSKDQYKSLRFQDGSNIWTQPQIDTLLKLQQLGEQFSLVIKFPPNKDHNRVRYCLNYSIVLSSILLLNKYTDRVGILLIHKKILNFNRIKHKLLKIITNKTIRRYKISPEIQSFYKELIYSLIKFYRQHQNPDLPQQIYLEQAKRLLKGFNLLNYLINIIWNDQIPKQKKTKYQFFVKRLNKYQFKVDEDKTITMAIQ